MKRKRYETDLYKPVKKYEAIGLHLVKYSNEDKCGRCCLMQDEKACARWSRFCEDGYFMKTVGYTKTFSIDNNKNQ